MRGVTSEAMVMCASSPEQVQILDPPPDSVPGERISCEGFTGRGRLVASNKADQGGGKGNTMPSAISLSLFSLSLLPAGPPDAVLNPKKKVFEMVQPELHTNEEGVACYRGIPLMVAGKGVCRAATMRSSGIK